MLASLLAFALIQDPGVAPRAEVGYTNLLGQEVPIVLDGVPGPFSDSTPHAEHEGFRFARMTAGGPVTRFLVDGGWEDARVLYQRAQAHQGERVLWRVRVFVAARSVVLDQGADGVWTRRLMNMERFHVDQLKRGIAQFEALAEAVTAGAIDVQVDLEVENDQQIQVVKASEREDWDPLGRWASLLPLLVNQDVFEADDRVFRGPYQNVFLVTSGATLEEGLLPVQGTPASVLSFFHGASYSPPQVFGVRLFRAWLEQERARRGESWPSRDLVLPDGDDPWPRLADYYPLPLVDAPAPALSAPTEGIPVLGASVTTPPSRGDFTVEPLTEGERVGWKVSEVGVSRIGWARLDGFAPPVPGTVSLRFMVRMESRDPVALELITAQQRTQIVMNGSLRAPAEIAGEVVPVTVKHVAVPTDGQWHEVSVPLAPGLVEDLREVRVGPPLWSGFFERSQLGLGTISISSLRFSTEPAGPIAERPADEGTTAAARLANIGEVATPEDIAFAVASLQSQSEHVRNNALAVFTRLRAAEAIPALIANSRAANHLSSYLALQALAHQGAPEAWAAIRLAVDRPLFDHVGRYAAEIMQAQPMPEMAASLHSLVASGGWRTRLAAARAVGVLETRAADIIHITMLQDRHPAVRLQVVQDANASMELACRRLLWTAVNDPFEVVRSAAYWGLIRSPIAEYQAEGYKGIRDESRTVRASLLDLMRAHPSEAHRPALRLAVVDTDPLVRAAAYLALAAQHEGVLPEEVESLWRETDPHALAAGIRLAKSKSVPVPPDTLARWRGMADEPVRQALLEAGWAL